MGIPIIKVRPSNLYNALHWRHNDHDSVSNHQPHGCLLNRLFRRRSKKTSKLRVTGLCGGNSQGTGEFPAQRASYAENVSIWWRHHEKSPYLEWWYFSDSRDCPAQLFTTIATVSMSHQGIFQYKTIFPNFNGLMQERCNFSALAMELRFSCINPPI